MLQMQLIVAIFENECDAGRWAAYLDGISALWIIRAHEELGHSVKRLSAQGIRPVLVILSSRLYPTGNPELASLIRTYFPGAELLLVSSSDEPSPPLLPLLGDAVRHLAVNPPKVDHIGRGYFDCVLQNLVAGRTLTVGDRLKPQTQVRSFELVSSEEKETLISAVDAAISGAGEEVEILRQRGALLADELMENALYGAPRDAGGGKLFRKGEGRKILPGERLAFSFGFDGETLAMEMTDSWGTLDADLVIEHLARNQSHQGYLDGVGGRGLFLIWRFFDHFHISIHPGQKTVVGGDLQLSARLDPEAPRGFHITAHKKGGSA